MRSTSLHRGLRFGAMVASALLACASVAAAAATSPASTALAASNPPTSTSSGSTVAATTPTGTTTAVNPGPLASTQCNNYYFCMWQYSGYGGIFWSEDGNTSNWTYVGDAFNDYATAIWNRRTDRVWVGRYYPPGSDQVCIGGGGGWKYANLNANQWPQDHSGASNTISSYFLSSDSNSCTGQPQFLGGTS